MLNKYFNQEALKPLDNPKLCKKNYVEQVDFYQYAYGLKWDFIDTLPFVASFHQAENFDTFLKSIYLIYSVDGSQAAYDFIQTNGVFAELDYQQAHYMELLVLLLRIYHDVGTAEDVDFVLKLMQSQLSRTLPRTLDIPDLYTHASLHALIARCLTKHNQLPLAQSSDIVVLDIQQGKLILSDVAGNTLPELANKQDAKIAAMIRVRNEADNIGLIIESIAPYVDVVIAYDDCSTDETPQIIKQYGEQGFAVELIEGTEWLFNESLIHQIIVQHGRKIGATHFVQLDADEVLSSKFTPQIFRELMNRMQPGDILALPWLNVNEDISGYYSEEKIVGISPSRSLKRYKDIAFADDGFTDFAEWQYAHVNTAPFVYRRRFLSLDDTVSLLHLEQINLLNYASKKDWYRIRAFAQNGKLPVDPYTDIRLPLLQLEDSVQKFSEPVYQGDGKLIEVFLKPAMLRLQSNAEGCELYPTVKNHMYLHYHLLGDNQNSNNISEK